MLSPQSQTLANTIEERLGIVVSVDRERGCLTLVHSDRTRSHLSADPNLLGNLRIGGPVWTLVQGTILRALRRL
jgi:hypothetical protein